MISARTLLLPLLIAHLSPATAADWPSWRGPEGVGTTSEKDLPTQWATDQNIVWKTALPEPGNSTPVLFGDRLFITQAKGADRCLMCFSKSDGSLLWEQSVPGIADELTHKTNPPCASSPVTDGTHVIAWFGSSGLHAFTVTGEKKWSLDLGSQRHIWGYGASPVLDGQGRCVLNFGPGERQFIVGVDIASGQIVWQHDEPGGASGEAGGKTWSGSWGDPLIREVNGRRELIHTFAHRMCAFDPATGAELWTCSGLNPLVYTSTLFVDDTAIGMGGYNGTAMAVRAGGSGDVTQTHRLWRAEKTRQRIGSGVVHEGHTYILTDPGIAECRSLATGELVWEERMKGPGPTVQNWSSLVLSADGLCYAVNQSGDGFVFRASPDFELIATNSLGEKVIGSVAVSDGRLFIRGHQHLWCIGQ